MTIGEVAVLVAKKEGHKSQTRIGDIREVLSILADMSYQSPDAIQAIIKLGISRSKRKKTNDTPKA